TFSWSGGVGASEYFLYVGNAVGANDIYGQSQGAAQSVTVTGLPTDGRILYVRLYSRLAAGWFYYDYTYTALRDASSYRIDSIFTNRLVYPVNLFLNDRQIGTVQASDTLTLTLDVPFTFTVSFRMVQPNPFGKPLG